MRILIAILTVAIAAPAHAQGQGAVRSNANTPLVISERALAVGLDKLPPSALPPQSRGDSIANGALIGAVIGGIAMGASGGWVCHMLREPSDPPCWKSVLPVAAIAAGIGAGVGAGIDALKMRQPRSAGPERLPEPLRRQHD